MRQVTTQYPTLLVLFSYFEGRPGARGNLRFFLDHALPDRSSAERYATHLFIINGFSCSEKLPEDRDDVLVHRRENTGFDLGSYTSALRWLANASWTERRRQAEGVPQWMTLASHTLLNVLPYQHFFFLNCGVRGPLLPPYWPAAEHWSRAYTRRLGDRVKLVGSSIVCLSQRDKCVKDDPGCYGPKVESFVFATDRAGLGVIIDRGSVLRDHASKVEAVIDGEYGMTRAVMDAGYTIDCLLAAYQGVELDRSCQLGLKRSASPHTLRVILWDVCPSFRDHLPQGSLGAGRGERLGGVHACLFQLE